MRNPSETDRIERAIALERRTRPDCFKARFDTALRCRVG
jgi:hypothetical protein